MQATPTAPPTPTTSPAHAAIIPILPDSAPFSPEQRAWLNGFFAGLLNAGANPNAATQTAVPNPTSEAPDTPPLIEIDEDADYPWHDAALSLTERLELAQDKPHPQRLMAAMAQLDCGSCGYECATYAKAIASSEEPDLTKCVPGAKETAKTLKKLIKEIPDTTPVVEPHALTVNANPPADRTTYDRNNPFPAPLIASKKLNKAGSTKDTRFIALDLSGSNLTYDVGDALGVYPENCPQLVDDILEALDTPPDHTVTLPNGESTTARRTLIEYYNITAIDEEQANLFAESATNDTQRAGLLRLATDDATLQTLDLLDLLQQFPDVRPGLNDLLKTLPALQPRLYSISSSLKAHPDEVHLTVGVVSYVTNNRTRKGVASNYLAERIGAQQTARVFVHKAHNFTPPANPDAPMIMVGPGTGIAPFRAFLEERQATQATGDNWLFFGDQHQATDFLYEHEITRYQEQGLLTRLDLAFSRDQDQKIYTQHRMTKNATEIWRWLQNGAHLYVCGDAKRMAKDVDNTLKQIVAQQGAMTKDAADAYVKQLTSDGRYQRDVY